MACAIFARDLLRVQRYWREAIYDTGLHSVIGHWTARKYALWDAGKRLEPPNREQARR
jgi:hypothetical protein